MHQKYYIIYVKMPKSDILFIIIHNNLWDKQMLRAEINMFIVARCLKQQEVCSIAL